MSTFTVEAARKQDRMRADGGTKTVYVVWLETERGATGRVEVPAAIWESDGLKGHLQVEADKLDKAFLVVNGD